MKVLVLSIVLCCVSAGAFLVQTQPLHQSTPGQQSLQILTKTLLSLTNHSAVVEEICRVYPTLIIPHPGECQLYYNCSLTYTSVPAHLEQHMVECNYPDLFSEKTNQCENFTDVCCGARTEFKDKCSYRHGNQNGYCHFKSCIGDPDGMVQIFNFHNFKICFKERLVGEGSCKLWFELPYKGKCTSRLDIPVSKGGLMPSCTGKNDGIYRFDHSSALENFLYYGDYFHIGRVCDAYYKCLGGTITVVKCENGTVFHMDSNTCKPGNSSLPNSCQLYCNPEKTSIDPFPVNVDECPYPLQFSETTGRCENFTEVACGTRKEEKYTCDYLETKYLNRHQGNCYYVNPGDCLHLNDGVYPHPHSKNLTLFIRCYRNRLVEEGNCPIDREWGTQTYPYKGNCTHRFAISTSEASYGLLPSCSSMQDGNYQFRTRPCDAYYRCEGGRATAVKCPEHTYYDVTSRRCSSAVACYRV
uniref:Chitin-binding type-2 domain-containing protein n=1 Tax=Magallana gigas TaxID=29159 RepID=A0A8W8LSC2_MAGGI|nr:uncharacterized protein LOC105340247 isoform X1 [Crassostrea gigas]